MTMTDQPRTLRAATELWYLFREHPNHEISFGYNATDEGYLTIHCVACGTSILEAPRPAVTTVTLQGYIEVAVTVDMRLGQVIDAVVRDRSMIDWNEDATRIRFGDGRGVVGTYDTGDLITDARDIAYTAEWPEWTHEGEE